MWTFGQDLMVRKSDDRIKSLSDANNPNIKIAVTLGGAGGPAAERFIPKAKVLTFPSGDQSGLALISGQVDAWCDDDFYHAIYVEDHPDLKQVPGTSVMQTATGMAVRHGSDLLPWINLYLYNIKTAGMFEELLEKWGLPAAMNAPWDPVK
jgi:ABC-type amino acid transport substrate-binding protein